VAPEDGGYDAAGLARGGVVKKLLLLVVLVAVGALVAKRIREA
jgi:hypothetical protein